ncbi:hypothetical protein [Ralstonia phage RP13]|nr:hypothetical protein [Ralstonia phage RP13]
MSTIFKDPILFVGAHADDIEINAGATISKLVNEGHNVRIAVMTHQNNTTRRKELSESLRVLDIPEDRLHHFAFIDTELYSWVSDMIKVLDQIINQHKIKTIFTHFHADTHQDHAAVSQASVAAGRNVDNIIFYKPTYPSGRTDIPFNSNLVIDLDEKYVDTKVEALAQHKSQIIKYGDESYLKAIKDICHSDSWVYGGKLGFAEIFQISRMKL